MLYRNIVQFEHIDDFYLFMMMIYHDLPLEDWRFSSTRQNVGDGLDGGWSRKMKERLKDHGIYSRMNNGFPADLWWFSGSLTG